MATGYDGINYFPIGVNFMEENAMEVIEAKYGIKGAAIVIKLLCKIYKEGYYIHWDEEQCLIFANKTGKEVEAEEVQGIIEILLNKEIFDRESYRINGILTSENIQKVWIEATKRRKRDLKTLTYLLMKDVVQQQQTDKTKEKADAFEERANTSREEKNAPKKEDIAVNLQNAVHDVAVTPKM